MNQLIDFLVQMKLKLGFFFFFDGFLHELELQEQFYFTFLLVRFGFFVCCS
jgi:hypothetical protein